jgi:peptidyl-prolyl cis-trans isomerase B (cyclophilin B)
MDFEGIFMQRIAFSLLALAVLFACGVGCVTTPPPDTNRLNADAGDDQNVAVNSDVTLTATAEGGTSPYRFRWSIEAQPTGADLDIADINTNAELPLGLLDTRGSYRFRVRVTDAEGTSDTSFTNVFVGGQLAVTASATDPLVVVGEDTTLSASLDAGTTGLTDIAFAWEVVDGSAELSDPAINNPTVTINAAETVQLRVTVTAKAAGADRLGTTDVFVVGVNDFTPQVIIQNTGGVTGRIVLELFGRSSPKTVANFLRYVDDGFYQDIVWHRVPPNNFVIQTGAFIRDEDGELVEKEGERATVASEASNGRSNVRGTVAMALRGDDANSGSNQFFVNIGDNTNLDTGPPAFTVFGRVVEGLEEVADEIAGVDTQTDGDFEDVPVTDIFINASRAGEEVPTDGDEDDNDPDAEEIEITASAADPVVVNSNATTLDVTFDIADVPGTPTFFWNIESGKGSLDNPRARSPQLTVTTNGTVEVQVDLRSKDDNDSVHGTATVFVVGVNDATPQVVLDVRSVSSGPFSISGPVTVELLTDAAPNTVANFLRYVDDGFYDGVLFHRVLAGEIVQTGGYVRTNNQLTEKTGTRDPIESEADNGEEHVRGAVAMALTGADADSAKSQFFIDVEDNPDLDFAFPPFTIFGRVVAGMDIIDQISQVDVDRDDSGLTNVPVEDIIIATASRRSDVQPLDVTATSNDPLVISSTATRVHVNFPDDDLPGPAAVLWEVVSGEATIQTPRGRDTNVTINTNGTVELRVRVTAHGDDSDAEGEASLFIVGIPTNEPTVVISNSGGVSGDIVLQLLADDAPQTVANFLRYVDEGFYDDIVWHRVIDGFVIQAGGFKRVSGDLEEQPVHDPVVSEAGNGHSNTEGNVAMALRGTDANSGTSQFFINLDDNSELDDGSPPFTVFATVIDGMDVVQLIAETTTTTEGAFEDVPEDDIRLTIRRGE